MKDYTQVSLATGTSIGVSVCSLREEFILDDFATAFCIDATEFIPAGYCFSSGKYNCPFFEVDDEQSISTGTNYRGI